MWDKIIKWVRPEKKVNVSGKFMPCCGEKPDTYALAYYTAYPTRRYCAECAICGRHITSDGSTQDIVDKWNNNVMKYRAR